MKGKVNGHDGVYMYVNKKAGAMKGSKEVAASGA